MSGANGTGHCGDCETTEQQLRVGAVNIVRENETRLTNALKVRKKELVVFLDSLKFQGGLGVFLKGFLWVFKSLGCLSSRGGLLTANTEFEIVSLKSDIAPP